jgi:hypothetical protein
MKNLINLLVPRILFITTVTIVLFSVNLYAEIVSREVPLTMELTELKVYKDRNGLGISINDQTAIVTTLASSVSFELCVKWLTMKKMGAFNQSLKLFYDGTDFYCQMGTM